MVLEVVYMSELEASILPVLLHAFLHTIRYLEYFVPYFQSSFYS